MSLVIEQAAFLNDVAKLIGKAAELGITITGGELYRTAEQQEIYLKTGKSKTANSNHLRRLAIDLNFFKPDAKGSLAIVNDKAAIQPLGDYWENLNPLNRWGGNFKSILDCPHFERNV